MKNLKHSLPSAIPRPCSGYKRFLTAAVCCALLAMAAVAAQTESLQLRLLLPPSNSSLPLLLVAEQDPIPGLDVRAELYQNHAQALA